MELTAARHRKTSAGIFTASMADVVFLLIVFFVLTYTFPLDPTRMELPRTKVRTTVPEGAAIISIAPPENDEMIRVSTGKERALPIGSAEEVVSFAATLIAADPGHPFVVRADQGVRYARIDTVLDALKQADARDVYLLSEQKTIE